LRFGSKKGDTCEGGLMKYYGWIFKLNLLVLGLILVLMAMSKVQRGSFKDYIASVLGLPKAPAIQQKATR
jgi:hypothetical protein